MSGDGVFEFVPKRHDFGDKLFLGTPSRHGPQEVEQALDILSRQPATARLCLHPTGAIFLLRCPSKCLVDTDGGDLQRQDGDIAAVLRTLFASPEFKASLGNKFKDPMDMPCQPCAPALATG